VDEKVVIVMPALSDFANTSDGYSSRDSKKAIEETSPVNIIFIS